MEITNIRHHRIRWRRLAALGAGAGLVGALVMLLISMATMPLLTDGDAWTFPKVISGALLGSDAATPLTGFESGPVIVGLVLQLVIGAIVGAIYGVLVAMFDLEGWTPVTLFGLIFGATTFVTIVSIISATVAADSVEALPIIATFWGSIAFGLTAGAVLARWADRSDLDQDTTERVGAFEGDEVRTDLPR